MFFSIMETIAISLLVIYVFLREFPLLVMIMGVVVLIVKIHDVCLEFKKKKLKKQTKIKL